MFLRIHKGGISIILCALFVCFAQYAYASEEIYTVSTTYSYPSFRFNNENWFTLTHPSINTFSIRDDGSAYGLTETGIPFMQYNIENNIGMRIQRFEIQDHYHYIIDGEVIYSFEDFSAELAQAYEAHSV
jgi:hypothetical protein